MKVHWFQHVPFEGLGSISPTYRSVSSPAAGQHYQTDNVTYPLIAVKFHLHQSKRA
ncbi:MAG TPA: hypothetical protein VFM76_09590 [Methylophaga sp.]|nr:hypothetical protein [Methylophaga sp.]